MFSTLDVFKTAMTMARHAGQQQALSAQNIANADTPGYRASHLPEFADNLPGDPSSPVTMRATRSSHFNGGFAYAVAAQDKTSIEDPNGNTVSLEREMVEAVNARRQHDRAMAIYRNSLSLMRSALGKT